MTEAVKITCSECRGSGLVWPNADRPWAETIPTELRLTCHSLGTTCKTCRGAGFFEGVPWSADDWIDQAQVRVLVLPSHDEIHGLRRIYDGSWIVSAEPSSAPGRARRHGPDLLLIHPSGSVETVLSIADDLTPELAERIDRTSDLLAGSAGEYRPTDYLLQSDVPGHGPFAFRIELVEKQDGLGWLLEKEPDEWDEDEQISMIRSVRGCWSRCVRAILADTGFYDVEEPSYWVYEDPELFRTVYLIARDEYLKSRGIEP